ncbi:putative type IX secretion system sortase PorU2 [Lacibacter sp. H407]|uniref:putative type IX secretion system sortase PorU2 n=1 Tax=Lacibacter sp. H407 TaxID=3133423 RepID=UPI0030C39983
MKRFLLSVTILFCGITAATAQTYMNEWIDFNKTYFKFKVGATGVYRISQSQLNAMGIANADASHFQLWRNGQQVPVYTSAASGTLPTNGFIEFWGQVNDGKWEKRMYLDPSYQINDNWSVYTDTSAYFLTVNTVASENKRFVETTNDLSSPLPAEPYFIHKAALYYRNNLNLGFAAVLESYVNSSSFDKGEGFTSAEFRPANPLISAQNNLFVAASGPNAKLKFSAVGRALNPRSVRVSVNGTIVVEKQMNYFNSLVDESANNIPLSLISGNTANVVFTNTSDSVVDRMVVGMYELSYPRQFNFGGQTNFEFELSGNAGGNNLVIDNFNFGGVPPVLYDLTNGLRITASIVSPTQIRVVLPASGTDRKLVLVSQNASNIRSAADFVARNFTNFSLPVNQSNYIIISNPKLYSDANGVNQVEQYRLYRSSITGGGYNVKIYEVQDILDQFGYGIKNNGYALKNFLRFAYAGFAVKPSYCLIIGKGVVYTNYRTAESNPVIDQLNLVPSFGHPASDMLLSSNEGSIVPRIPIGRLTVVNGNEVRAYLNKVKQYEQFYNINSCNIQDEIWKKNVIHVAGANDYLGEQIRFYLNQYGNMLKDTSFGASVYSLQKTGVANIQTIANSNISRLFQEGFSLLTYYGHSSPTTLEYNLDDPTNYPSIGKYPIIMVNGCQAGNMFLSDVNRLTGNYIITEKWVLTPDRGSVAFIASTHLGIANYLHVYTEEFYNQLSKTDGYGKSIGRIMANVSDSLSKIYSFNDFYIRHHLEQITLHGDPAIKFFSYEKPDYAIEESMVRVSPEFISIADSTFDANIKIVNIGKATTDSVQLRITRIYPNGSSIIAFDQKIKRVPYSDSVQLKLRIDPFKDKGSNKLKVEIDPDNLVNENCETNNSVIKDFFIFEDEIRPVYPYNYSIVNKQNITYYASTANPLGTLRKYYFEIDTTQKFNSALRKSDSLSSVGGSISFKPSGINFADSVVYYWRVGMRPEQNSNILWNNFSFVYIPGSNQTGFNQSHFFQLQQNNSETILLDSVKRRYMFDSVISKLQIQTAISPYHPITSNDLSLDYNIISRQGCNLGAFKFYVLNEKTLKPMENWMELPWAARFFSHPINCLRSTKEIYFEYSYYFSAYRSWAMSFMDSIPANSYVIVINYGTAAYSIVGPSALKEEEATLGPGNSLYHKLYNQGFTMIDSFRSDRPMIFVYKKNDPSFTPIQIVGNPRDLLTHVLELPSSYTSGKIESPWFGPVKSWKELKWEGSNIEPQTPDSTTIDIIGRTNSGSEFLLSTLRNIRDTTLDFISPLSFPYLKLRLNNFDKINVTPHQLSMWRLYADYVPEGAIAPNVAFRFKDSLDLGEPLDFSIAFRNVSETAFDSLKLKLIVTDRNNVPHNIPLPKKKPLAAGDSIVVSYIFDTKDFEGLNTLYLMVNPDEDQPEQVLFNNFIYKDFFVKQDNYKPWLDVTFDGSHILNRDIVSSKPHILVQLKDDSRFLALNDTSGMKIKIRFPDNTIREYKPNSDSVRFTPANLTNGNNAATIDLYPYFTQDGEYELIVTGNDVSGNKAGELDYKVAFQVINKPMISNLLNYPNPFTSSTAFVFTITGSEIPQNLRIQILTITGKVVREITKAELGSLRIGRNITDFKWDGTDQFGNKLGNGIYLYRVITNLNGKSLDRYKSEGENTDQYFNKGYGKMYLMR